MFRQVAAAYIKKIIAGKSLRQAAPESVRLDPKIKRQVNNAFGRHGLDERGNFETAEKGYSAAWEMLSGFNIVVDDIISSHIFRDGSTDDGKADDGQQNLWLAFKTDDPFTNTQIKNSKMVFAFHRKETGKFGCLVYLS